MEKENYYVVSLSGGKDSTALLLHLLELGKPVDEVINCDTGKEFPAMYRHIQKIRKVVEDAGIKFTTLKNEKSFDYYMKEEQVKHKNPEAYKEKYGDVKGFSWPDYRNRWCSYELKVGVMSKYLKELKKKKNVIQYVGLAADETKRLERKTSNFANKVYPLVEWGWTEEDCLNYCYSLGYDWEGLYKLFRRVSCWCCPLQCLDDIRTLRKNFPDLWQELQTMDAGTWRNFKPEFSLQELEKRFQLEEKYIAKGENIRSRKFFKEMKELLGRD